MPLFDYTCECGAKERDHIVRDDAVAEAPNCVRCGACMNPIRVYAARTVGPIWANVEAYERSLLTPRERSAGLRITGPDDVRILEARLLREQGLRPLDPESAECKQSVEADMDYVADRDRIVASELPHGGMEAAAAVVEARELREEVQADTGWTSAEYARWSNANEAAERALESGALPLSAPDPGAGLDAGGADGGGAGAGG